MDAELLDRTSAALAEAVPDLGPDGLVPVGRGQSRRRSELYFLGLRSDELTCRWVLKVPHPGSRQHDLTPPRTAPEQLRALERLHAHLGASGTGVSVPRPVALLPDVGGYLMEFVRGPTLTDELRPRALLDDRTVMHGVVVAARLLRELHSLEATTEEVADVAELEAREGDRARRALREAGLPVRPRWFRASSGAPSRAGRKVVLHGDFAPENIVLGTEGLCCLDPDLVDTDWAEHDVVRFVLMLADAPLFVLLTDLPAAQRLRRKASLAFLVTYYAGVPPGPALRPLMMSALATRWATRHVDVAARRPHLGRARQLLLRRHFEQLLDEVGSSFWPWGGR